MWQLGSLNSTGLSEPEVSWHPQTLADHLPLSQLGGLIMPNTFLLAPPDFQTFLRSSSKPRNECYLLVKINSIKMYGVSFWHFFSFRFDKDQNSIQAKKYSISIISELFHYINIFCKNLKYKIKPIFLSTKSDHHL